MELVINPKYVIRFEKAPSANLQDGFKVEISSDELEKAKTGAAGLYVWACNQVKVVPAPVAPITVKEK